MKILVLNGSPKGSSSITLQTVRYLENRHPEHSFQVLHAGQKIKVYENDFSEVKTALEEAELVLFVYPVYTFLAPFQVHRLIELIKENGVNLKGKYASQITTSKHFYDVTAHAFIEENCKDMGMKFIRGLSADMEDLIGRKGQREADSYFKQMIYSIRSDTAKKSAAKTASAGGGKCLKYDVVIVHNCAEKDAGLKKMIADFKEAMPVSCREINIREFPFRGGCLGCLSCAVTGKCIYTDGFDEFLRKEIQQADAIVYAFAIENHYTHSSFKNFDDRQFCNGHRTVTSGTPVAYLIRGKYSKEHNLQMVVEGRSQVGGNYLAGVATDEGNTAKNIEKLASDLMYALRHKCTRPQNFYGVGGAKIFRDLIYTMRGMMKADHQYYKAHGMYDFPQKEHAKILLMKMVGAMSLVPALQKQMKSKMGEYMLAPYQKAVDNAVQRGAKKRGGGKHGAGRKREK